MNVTVSIDEQLMQDIRVFRDGGGTFPISERVENALRSALDDARKRWKELRHFAGVEKIDVESGHDDEYGNWIAFIGPNHPSDEDYSSPAFVDEEGNEVYEVYRCRRYWLGWLEGIRSVYWEVWDYMEPEALIGRAQAVGLRVMVNKGMAVLVGSLEGVQDRDATLLSDFSAHRAEITTFLQEQQKEVEEIPF